MLKNMLKKTTPSIVSVAEFMFQLFILLLVLAVPGEPEPAHDSSGAAAAALGSPHIEDSLGQHLSSTNDIPNIGEAEISDEDENEAAMRMTVNGTVIGENMQKQLSLKCGNKFNVEVFRELNGFLNERVIPLVCDDETRSPLKRIAEDYCRLGVLHNICEAVPDKCGEDRDQVFVVGIPIQNKDLALMDSASGAAAVLYFHFWKYISSSEAASISWVYEPLCEERKGSALILLAIQHVDYDGSDDGYCGHHDEHPPPPEL